MKTAQQLKEVRAAKVTDLEAIVKTAKAEARSFTEEEETRQSTLISEIESLDTQIKTAEQRERILKTAAVDTPSKGEEKELGEIRKSISLTKALREIQAGGTLTGAEAEMSQEARNEARQAGVSMEGFAIPQKMLQAEARNFDAGDNAHGGYAVATETGDIIEALRPRPLIAAAGAEVMEGLSGIISLPREVNYATPGMKAETAEGDNGPTDPFGELQLSPKRMSAYTDVSMQLLMQTSPSIDAFISKMLRREGEIQIDAQAINGSGSGNEARGILNTVGIGSVAGGANGAVPTFGNIVDLKTAVAEANGLVGNLAYLTTPGIQGKLEQVAKDAGSGRFVVEENRANGYDIMQSTLVPSTLTKGTSNDCHAVVFGNFNELILGFWGGVFLTVDEKSLAKDGKVRIVLNRWFDVGVRHAGSFAAMLDAKIA